MIQYGNCQTKIKREKNQLNFRATGKAQQTQSRGTSHSNGVKQSNDGDRMWIQCRHWRRVRLQRLRCDLGHKRKWEICDVKPCLSFGAKMHPNLSNIRMYFWWDPDPKMFMASKIWKHSSKSFGSLYRSQIYGYYVQPYSLEWVWLGGIDLGYSG